jgi:hypothetical protein
LLAYWAIKSAELRLTRLELQAAIHEVADTSDAR